nr:MAG TPA: hypothetical protein [Caudoviricetes sp.]
MILIKSITPTSTVYTIYTKNTPLIRLGLLLLHTYWRRGLI